MLDFFFLKSVFLLQANLSNYFFYSNISHCPLPFFLILIPHTISFFPHNLVSCHDEIKCNWNKDTTKVLEVLSEDNFFFFKNHLFLCFVSVFQRRRRHQRIEGHAEYSHSYLTAELTQLLEAELLEAHCGNTSAIRNFTATFTLFYCK